MLNPDGVIHGNYRTSLSGSDLNRRWHDPSRLLHPEIYYCKNLIHDFASSHEIALYCDFHGHSIKKNVFFYGCCAAPKTAGNTSNTNTENLEDPLACRQLPYLYSKLSKNFSFPDCNFAVQ